MMTRSFFLFAQLSILLSFSLEVKHVLPIMNFRKQMSESIKSTVGRLAKLRKFRRRTIDSAQIRLGRKENSNHLESLEEENLTRLSENITQSIPGRRRSQKRCIEDDDDGKAKSNKVSFNQI